MAGYHLTQIPRGVLGKFSKVEEEFNEFIDAHEQNCKLMELLELSDLLGCAKHYYLEHDCLNLWESWLVECASLTFIPSCTFSELKEAFSALKSDQSNYVLFCHFLFLIHYYVGQYKLTVFDLLTMANITERAFINGFRT